ncbi:hypothetical protein HDU84_009386, partial [Entophlyctis sp. JEL0112]
EVGVVDTAASDVASEALVAKTPRTKMVLARSFNSVQTFRNFVVKSSKDKNIRGEMFFYAHCPEALKHYFPSVTQLDHQIITGYSSITMAKIEGVTFSHLLMNLAITKGRFQKVLDALHALHLYAGPLQQTSDVLDTVQRLFSPIVEQPKADDLKRNYAEKVRFRYEAFKEVYEKVAPSNHSTIANMVLEHLEEYQSSGRCKPVSVIHGDPVFSNIMVDRGGRIIFLDMRGMLGDSFAIGGDAVYDLAKIYQSLRGYDYYMMSTGDKALTLSESRHLQDLEHVFWSHVTKHYPEVCMKDVKTVTGSLIFSLLPLHEDVKKIRRYWEICQQIVLEI